jgi:hypothetical protein
MQTNSQPPEPPDISHFNENRCNFPLEELIPYEGLFVAWSPDGTRIVASAETREALYQNLAAMGIHFSQVVFDYIDSSDAVLLY